MKILIVNKDEVRQLLLMDDCMDIMTEALITLSKGEGGNPLRQSMFLPE